MHALKGLASGPIGKNMENRKLTIGKIIEELGLKFTLFALLGLAGLCMMVTKCTVALTTPSKEQLMYERFADTIRKDFNLSPKTRIEFGERDSIKTYTQGLRGRDWTVNSWIYAQWIDTGTKKYQPVKCQVNESLYTTYETLSIYACEKVDFFRPR